MQIWEKCSYAHRQDDEQPSKKSKKNGDKSAVAVLKNTRQLGCVSQDMELPKSSSILRKISNILKPIRCVRFTEAVLRHANIRDTKNHRWNDLPVTQMLQNLRFGRRRRQSGKSKVPAKQCGRWPKVY